MPRGRPKNVPVKRGNGNLPAYLQTGDVTKDYRVDDIAIQRLKIVQGLTDKTVKEVATEGDLYNNVTHDVYPQPFGFFVVIFWRSEIWMKPGKGLLGQVYGDMKVGPEIDACLQGDYGPPSDSFNYILVPESELLRALSQKTSPGFLIYNAQSAALKYARQLNSRLAQYEGQKIPQYAHCIEMTTELQAFSNGNEAWMPHFTFSRWAEKPELDFLKEFRDVAQQYIKAQAAQNADVTPE